MPRSRRVRKDAIIKGLLSTLESTAITTDSSGDIVSSTPLQDLCQISKEACDAVTPMLKAFYEKISDQRHGGSSKLKSDATYFTIADGAPSGLDPAAATTPAAGATTTATAHGHAPRALPL